MIWESTSFWTSLFGMIGVVATAYVAYKRITHSNDRVEQAEQELALQSTALDFGYFIREWDETQKTVEDVLDHTCFDRFMLLRAWNGRIDPKWTTAVYQMRKGNQEPISYIHFELDPDYVTRLQEIYVSGIQVFNVEEMPDCAIRQVYKAEKVTYAVWVHLGAEKVVGSDSTAHTYCSFATHEKEPPTEADIAKCRIVAGRLKGVAQSYGKCAR